VSALPVVLVLVWAVAVTTVAAVDSVPAAGLTGALLLIIGLLSVQVAKRAGLRSGRGSVDRQITVGIAMPVVQMIVAAGLFGGVMFFSTHDAILIMLVSLFAGTLGLLTARMATRRLVADVRAVRDGLVDVGAGRRDRRIEAEGSTELVELADAANAMTERLGAEERARRNLIAAISHDLRTPLTSMRLVVEALDDEILDGPERRVYVDRLRLNIAALHGLIEDLFELSRLEAGETTWSREPVDLAMLVGDTVDAMQADAQVKRVRIVSDIPDDLARMLANPEKLQRVLFNLLQNAIRHTPAGSAIVIAARSTGRDVEVDVADAGPGIDAAERGTIFDAFVQGGDRSTRTAEGAGLGLAIARAIVEAHGGRICIVDAETGARVRFTLPLAGD
jgi:signal transduction histidine kinase